MPRLRSTSLHDGWSFAEKTWQKEALPGAPKLAGARVGYSRLEWLPARVPGHVHLDLIENGIIGHPFERMQELGCQWVDEKDWSYRTRFDWQPDAERPRRVLRFEGLDTVCSVHLNGVELGRHDNMFVPFEIDVTDALRAGENSLRVDFESAVKVGNARRAAYFEAEGIATDCERFEERAFVRKVQCMFGWDWGPRLVSAGIFRPVVLLEYWARIDDVHVTQEHRSDGSVAVLVESTVPAGTKILHVWDDEPPTVDGCVSEIEQPELWYPHGLGAQRLFELVSFLVPDGFSVDSLAPEPRQAKAQLEAAALDVRRQRIGLRRLRLVREPDRFGESFELEVNGRRFYSFGANWIPAHAFPSTITRGALKEHLLAARRAGMNTLRVWGGGLYESDDFYELCDELGLVVWQDFPFACSYYPDGPAEQTALTAEARSNIVRLRNHASLAVWCGNNENLQMFQQRWGEPDKHPARYYGEKLYDQILPDLLRELDSGRSYTPTSPHGGEDCQSGGIGDQHYWDVWHGRGDWVHYQDSTARFSSEYGFASAPSLRAFQQIFPPRRGAETTALELSELRAQYRDPIVRWHDKTLKGYETFVGYVLLHYPEPRSLQDWIYYSQLNQRDALRFAIEHYRRSEFCKGSLIWQLNDCWPVQSWALEDSLGEPKPALVALQRLYAPGLITLSRREERVELWGILDNAKSDDELTGTAVLRAVSLSDGKLLGSWSAGARVASSERKLLLTVDVAALPRSETLLFAELGRLQAWCLLTEPKDLVTPPPGPLQVSLAGDGRLALRTPGPVVDLWLSDESGSRSFEQNLLTLPAACTTSLTYSGGGRGLKARSLAGEHSITLTRAPLY
jgi:beta-mannosidase